MARLRSLRLAKGAADQEQASRKVAPSTPIGRGLALSSNLTGVMRSGPDQRSRGRSNGNRPPQQQPRGTQHNQSFDSRGLANVSEATPHSYTNVTSR